MANMKNNVVSVIAWLHAALDMLIVLVRESKNPEAIELIQDIRDVISSYMEVFRGFVPEKPLEPIPGNWFKKIGWVIDNMGWLQTVIMLCRGVNPFEPAKMRAAMVAQKWQFVFDNKE